jgi:Tol biopolymer transport system component
VHRDLKPENIMIGKDGRVKILDFGLSRQASQTPPVGTGTDPEETLAPDPDAARNLTEEGTVIGTASYMSPEQATGRAVDYRSDQFSLGLVLHEMATGKQTFARSSRVETMAAIVRDEPPAIGEKVPVPLRWTIDRCLQKEPEQRYESTRDLFQDLKNLREHLSESYTSGTFTPVATQAKSRRWGLAAICLGCVLLAGLLGYLLKPAGQDIGNYRYTPFASNANSPVWSPDGKAVAYSGQVNSTWQTFLRYLNSPVAIQLTHEKFSNQPLGWSKDGAHLILLESTDRRESPFYKLYSVATVGGEPDFIMDSDCDSCDLSRDGKAFAMFARDKNGVSSVSVSDPLGSPLRPYTPALFASKDVSGNTNSQLQFSPDGKKLMLFRAAGATKDEAWLLPYPAGSQAPRVVLKNLASPGDPYPEFSWLPDSRHVIASLSAYLGSPDHLWMADIESSSLAPVTTGSMGESYPAVSPDGKSVLYSHNATQWAIVAVSLDGSSVKTLISTDRRESMAAWSANQAKLAWVTNRTGPAEIWVRLPDGSDRQAVTAQDFPPESNKWFTNPSLSPDGERLIYGRTDQAGAAYLWMSSLSGGSPVRLTNAQTNFEFGGSWSPDGKRFVYLKSDAGQGVLMTVRTTGNAAPVLLKKLVAADLPDWSPVGDWITCHGDDGWSLISPDGKTAKFLGQIHTEYLAFSKDGKLLYGIDTGETEADHAHATLFSLDPATRKRKDIKELGPDLIPETNITPGIRFSLAPDGKSFVYTTARRRKNLWMLLGYRQPSWFSRF